VIEVLSSAIIARGKVEQILSNIWEIASAGNVAQLTGDLYVAHAVLKGIH
jgi:hypothetical protein